MREYGVDGYDDDDDDDYDDDDDDGDEDRTERNEMESHGQRNAKTNTHSNHDARGLKVETQFHSV